MLTEASSTVTLPRNGSEFFMLRALRSDSGVGVGSVFTVVNFTEAAWSEAPLSEAPLAEEPWTKGGLAKADCSCLNYLYVMTLTIADMPTSRMRSTISTTFAGKHLFRKTPTYVPNKDAGTTKRMML